MSISRTEYESARDRSMELLKKAGIIITDAERTAFEVADFGLGQLETEGLEIITYVNTDRCCAKELVMFPHQTCPEHRHPYISDANPGKEETFRCRWGTVHVFVSGDPTPNSHVSPPGKYYTARHEITLKPGEQYTLLPNTPHWFQAGDEGAIVSEFSTHSTDENDIFTDPNVAREPVVA